MWVTIQAVGEEPKEVLATSEQYELACELCYQINGGALDDHEAILRALIGLDRLGYQINKKQTD